MKLGFCGLGVGDPGDLHARAGDAKRRGGRQVRVVRRGLGQRQPSGESCGRTVHAPGTTFGVAVVARALAGLAFAALPRWGAAHPKLALMVTSG